MASMPERTALTEGSWDDLFDFLDPNRHEARATDRDSVAEARCLEIMRKLVCFFAGRGCGEAEDLAVETILRVAARCRSVEGAGYADRIGYFYGVARNVLHEWVHNSLREGTTREALKHELARLPTPDPRSWSEKERVHRCLELCLAKLTHRARRLILSYYSQERTAKIEHHRSLAAESGKSVNALRIEVHRIRRALQECVFGRLDRGGQGTDSEAP